MKEKVHRKLFVGPMSTSVVDAVKDIELSQKVGLIPSRRQIEYSGGYVNNWTTFDFLKYSEGIVRCRDHAGPMQGDHLDDGLESLNNDCNTSNHFEIIHIDPWKKEKDIHAAAVATCELIKYCSAHNEKILFEIGTEQGIRPYNTAELEVFLSTVERSLGSLFDKVLYCVIQGGTGLKGISNTGNFDPIKCESMVNLCRSRGLLSKEHNGDYLADQEISQRFQLGLDSINIAPELGVNESTVLVEKLNSHQLKEVYEICYRSKKWKKWFHDGYQPNDDASRLDLIKASCHYSFSHPEVKRLSLAAGITKEKTIELHKQFLTKKLNLAGQ